MPTYNRIHHAFRLAAVSTAFLSALLMNSNPCRAQINVDFNSVDASAGNVPADALLAQYGITISGVTTGTQVVIEDNNNIYGGVATRPSSPPNILTQEGNPYPQSYTFNFATPLDSIAFTRIELISATSSGVTHPLWDATAYDDAGQVVATAGEELIASFGDVPAARFTLTGTDITSLQIYGNCELFAGFSSLLMDDLTLYPSASGSSSGSSGGTTAGSNPATPEPGMFGFGGAFVLTGTVLYKRKRRNV